jgi:hypothetical protein
MCMRRLTSFLFLFTLVGLVMPEGTVAQSPLEATQLPARTTFYLVWHGSPAGEARKNNALMSLWDDPDLAPMRAAMVDAITNDAKKQKEKPAVTREDLAQIATLLDNPFTLGYLPRREAAAPKVAAGKTTTPAWNGMFFVYDRSGKEELLSKTVLQMRSSDKEIPKLSEVTIAGVKALKIEKKSGTTYWAETGKYAVAAGEESIFEEVLNRLAGKSAGGSLADLEAYKEAKPLLSGGLLEFFLRVPQIKDMAGDSSATTPEWKAMWSNLKLESLHVFADSGRHCGRFALRYLVRGTEPARFVGVCDPGDRLLQRIADQSAGDLQHVEACSDIAGIEYGAAGEHDGERRADADRNAVAGRAGVDERRVWHDTNKPRAGPGQKDLLRRHSE